MKQPLYTGAHGKCHIQGIAVDEAKGYVYYSFTTKLVKATLDGEVVGILDGLVGHLGCIAFNKDDGYLYGSLEYKNDSIGRGILGKLGSDAVFADGFYVARFDVDRITESVISCAGSDIMTCAYLDEVVRDYSATVSGVKHRYGCSGIDGITIAHLPGAPISGERYLYVAYGIYGDTTRTDNDHQILLCYELGSLALCFKPLDQENMHKVGPQKPCHKYFVYTGNTHYGVQNLEYDPYTDTLLMAVYKGKKPQFPNYSLFAVDMSRRAEVLPLAGLREDGEKLSLAEMGDLDNSTGIRGWHFPHGSTGLYSFGDGSYIISENRVTTEGQCGYLFRYLFDGKTPFITLA